MVVVGVCAVISTCVTDLSGLQRLNAVEILASPDEGTRTTILIMIKISIIIIIIIIITYKKK